jgi:hypothetical protein
MSLKPAQIWQFLAKLVSLNSAIYGFGVVRVVLRWLLISGLMEILVIVHTKMMEFFGRRK